jgi:phosphoglycolate phosphatase
MSTQDSILFDLDGTLWDITSTVMVARNNTIKKLLLNTPLVTEADISATMGFPLDEVYRRAFPTHSAAQLKDIQKEMEAEIGRLLETIGAKIYPGVHEGLKKLSEKKKLFIVSNCGTDYLEYFLDWSKFRVFFKDYECFGTTRLPKSENIKSVIARNNLTGPIYVGDTKGDHEAALAAGVPYIHVNYGFGEPLSACRRVSSFPELVELFL